MESAKDHNSRLPVSQLPGETLAQVFQVHATGIRYQGSRINPLPSQVIASHVCQQWRDVAVSTAALWTRFRVDKDMPNEALDHWIARSKQAPLYLSIRYDCWQPEAPPACLQKSLEQLPRIHSLQLSLPPIHLKPFLMETSPITALETLDLTRPTGEFSETPEIPAFLKILADRFPCLSTLHINAYRLDEWPLPSTLTILSVGTQYRYIQMPLDRVLRALQGLPLLEELSLYRICLENSRLDPSTIVLQQVSLVHLRKLSFHGANEPDLYLLDQLAFPPLQRLHLELKVHRLSDLLRHPKLFQAGLIADISLRSLVLRLSGSSNIYIYARFELRAWRLPQSLEQFRDSWESKDEDLRIVVTPAFPTSRDLHDDGRMIAHLLSSLPLSEVEILGLRCDFGRVLYSGTQKVLWNLNKVHTLGFLVAHENNQDHTIAYLSELLRHPTVVFPELSTLYLQCVRFRQDMPIFLRILSQREQKAPIAQLVLRGCDDVTPPDIRSASCQYEQHYSTFRLESSHTQPEKPTGKLTDMATKAARDHNDTLPISKLPNEILAKVFRVHATGLRCKNTGKGSLPFQVAVSHVCQRWRKVAISTAVLWTRFRVKGHTQHKALDQWMARSQHALLYLNIKYDCSLSETSPAYLKEILKQLPRICSLQSSLPAIQFEQHFLTERLPITTLKTLKLTRPTDLESMAADDPAILKTLAARFPHLCALHLSGYRLDGWTLPSTLTVLSVGSPRAYIKIPLDNIIKTLQGLPLLQELSLHHAGLESAPLSNPGTALQQVSLLHLRKLSIRGYGGSELYLLDQLAFPPLQFFGLRLTVETLSELFHCRKLFQAGLIDIPLASLVLNLDASETYQLRAWRLPRSLERERFETSYLPEDEDLWISITFPLGSDLHRDDGKTIAKLLTNLPISEAEVLGLQSDLPMFYSDTKAVLWKLTKVHTLGFSVDHHSEQNRSIEHLTEIFKHPSIVFPKLSTLYLQYVHFDGGFFSRIFSRHRTKVAIAQLVLRGCNDLTPEDILSWLSENRLP
ncbi:hypothetical protein EIP86_006803 [Pleurotus ostreatoroseus]|nr:hypothetical protein EIP86_006803 [Pleurotus ostreatoroseus]